MFVIFFIKMYVCGLVRFDSVLNNQSKIWFGEPTSQNTNEDNLRHAINLKVLFYSCLIIVFLRFALLTLFFFLIT